MLQAARPPGGGLRNAAASFKIASRSSFREGVDRRLKPAAFSRARTGRDLTVAPRQATRATIIVRMATDASMTEQVACLAGMRTCRRVLGQRGGGCDDVAPAIVVGGSCRLREELSGRPGAVQTPRSDTRGGWRLPATEKSSRPPLQLPRVAARRLAPSSRGSIPGGATDRMTSRSSLLRDPVRSFPGHLPFRREYHPCDAEFRNSSGPKVVRPPRNRGKSSHDG